jgi:hypothetical protein|tara:strand:+ start:516 stop:1106 length:591 start_codon:yes stop_codon:yes gene_type:complete
MQISENATNFLERNMTAGRAIPGQSLTNSPETPHRWEQPPEFSEPHKAMLQIFETITEKESLSNILLSLSKKVSVVDLSSIILYSGFIEGKWNPDLMTLLMEPTMYMIMYLGDKANLDYSMDSRRENNVDEASGEEQLKRITSSLDELKQVAADRVSPMSVTPEIKEELEAVELPTSLLDRVETEPTNDSLLSREA